jgi:hypothetical protein
MQCGERGSMKCTPRLQPRARCGLRSDGFKPLGAGLLRAALGRMRWVSDEDVDRYTAFVRIAAHTLVTSDVSYRDCGVMRICGFYTVFGGRCCGLRPDACKPVGAGLLRAALGRMRWVSDEDVDRYTAFAALVTSDVSHRYCGVMRIGGVHTICEAGRMQTRRSRLAGECGGSAMKMSTDTPRSLPS